MKLFAAKILFAVLAIGTLLLAVASQVAPSLPWWKVLLGAAAFAMVFFAVALIHAYIAGTLRELLLRWGAIDTQWLWSPDYPEGFKRYFRRSSGKGANEP